MERGSESNLLRLRRNKGKNKNVHCAINSAQSDCQKEFGNAPSATKNLQEELTI